MEFVQGASTIPQQLIRSSFLTREKTLERKTKEIILTLELDRRYPKDQILEWYLNQVSFGPNIYGVETASKSYFGKSVSEITLAQAALLAATIKAPSYLYPYGEHLEELLGRKDYVLNRMADYLIRNSRFPALFLDPETLYLRRLQKALYRALIDYHERLEGHSLRCCPEPAVFHGRFEDFVRLTVIPRMAKPLEEAARRLPEHTNHIQQLLKRILDLVCIQGQTSFTGSAAEPQIKASS